MTDRPAAPWYRDGRPWLDSATWKQTPTLCDAEDGHCQESAVTRMTNPDTMECLDLCGAHFAQLVAKRGR